MTHKDSVHLLTGSGPQTLAVGSCQSSAAARAQSCYEGQAVGSHQHAVCVGVIVLAVVAVAAIVAHLRLRDRTGIESGTVRPAHASQCQHLIC